MKARAVIQTGRERPEVKKSALVETFFFSSQPIPMTNAKYTARIR
jgi:hypothetical protein